MRQVSGGLDERKKSWIRRGGKNMLINSKVLVDEEDEGGIITEGQYDRCCSQMRLTDASLTCNKMTQLIFL